jgi:3-methylcrotonyl-CoA carboxylase alpha subunit
MGQAAVRLGQAVGYTNAGTVEFMADDDGYYFLEMNTRLQVEHGVTELRTGLDLVELQLTIAAGQKLPFNQQRVRFTGHAMECRVYAEDPQNNYLPSPGTISTLVLPEGEGVRNDVGTYEGDEISTFYDPMISKLLTRGLSRFEVIDRMERALADYQVEGVRTNLSLLRTIVAHPAFRTGSVTTEFLDNELPAEALADQATDAPLLSALGFLLLGGDRSDAWRAAGPLRTAGRARLDLEHSGRMHVMTARRMASTRNKWMVTVDNKKRPVQFALASLGRVIVENDGQTHTARVSMRRGGIQVVIHDRAYDFVWSFGEQPRGAGEHARPQGLVAPMNGLVLKLLVKPGDKVVGHQTVAVIEAMKMEHSIEAPHDGVVKEVFCKEGGRVTAGQVLMELEHEGEKPA